jgi:hypothetical protein
MFLGLVLLGCVTTKRYAFVVTGDPQYLAEKSATPTRLDPYSEQANVRFLEILRNLPGRQIAEKLGGGVVSSDLLGVLVVGDLIDSLDKNGGNYPAMQRFEWDRFLADYGLLGTDGGLPYPVYETWGNHDGPQGDSFLIADIATRNKSRVGVTNISPNGLHYSWDFGPVHFVHLGMFAGQGDKRREGHHYAPRSSLEFLRSDLETQVGSSGRPVILGFHLHPNGPEYDWPAEDLKAFWEAMQPYQIAALFHGHTHGSPPSRMRWDGVKFGQGQGLDVYNPDDSGAAKTDPKDPAVGKGLRHGFLYVEVWDRAGTAQDEIVVRSYFTKDNWQTHSWGKRWVRALQIR